MYSPAFTKYASAVDVWTRISVVGSANGSGNPNFSLIVGLALFICTESGVEVFCCSMSMCPPGAEIIATPSRTMENSDSVPEGVVDSKQLMDCDLAKSNPILLILPRSPISDSSVGLSNKFIRPTALPFGDTPNIPASIFP